MPSRERNDLTILDVPQWTVILESNHGLITRVFAGVIAAWIPIEAASKRAGQESERSGNEFGRLKMPSMLVVRPSPPR